MPRRVLIAAGLAAAVLLAVWGLGGLGALEAWAQGAARGFQNAMATALRRLRAAEPGAIWALIGLAFVYGVAHSVGPGHGKFLIGGYGMARRVRLVPLASVALAASLAQATTALVLVYGGLAVLGWTRARIESVAEVALMPISHALVALIGVWLVWRGLARMRAGAQGAGQASPRLSQERHPAAHEHDHSRNSAHSHSHDRSNAAEGCNSCGHRHGPSLDEVERLAGWRDAALLIGGIALRPCTGALFLLIVTWQLGLFWAGIAGVYAMGLGTALVTVGVAVLAVLAREGALATVLGAARLRLVMPMIEVAAGAVILLIAGALLLRLA